MGGIEGRTLTCYHACSTEAKLAGANYKKVSASEVVVDGNLVTSPAWPGVPKLLAAFIEILGTKISHS